MPIPVSSDEESALKNQQRGDAKESMRLVTDEVIWTHKPELMARERVPFPTRLLAHCVDLFVVQGFGIYAGKLWSLVLLANYMGDINLTGKRAGDILLDVFSYGNSYLAVGCSVGVAILYFLCVPYFLQGKTLGLALFGLRIETDDHHPLELRVLAVRFFCYAVSYMSFGFVFLLGMRHPEGKLLHDEISKTRIVHFRE